MGLSERDYMRGVFDDTAGETSRFQPNRITIAVACVVFLCLAYVIGTRYWFPDRWNAIDRVLNLNSVGWVGISWSGVDPATIGALGVPCALEIDSVAKGGPGEKAGLLPGDLIVGLNGRPFSDGLQLQGDAKYFRPGQTITLNVDRAGTTLAVPVTLCTWEQIEQLNVTGGVSL